VFWAVVVGFAAPKENDAPVGAAVVVAGVAPKENEGADATGAVAPNAGAVATAVVEPNVGGALVAAGVVPNVNNPDAAAGAAAVVAGGAAAPKLNGLIVATEEAVVTATEAPKVGAAVDAAAGVAPKEKSPGAAAWAGAVAVVAAVAGVAPNANGLLADVVVLEPKDGRVVEVAGAVWPKEKLGTTAADVVTVAEVLLATTLKLEAGRVAAASTVLEDPKEKTAEAAVVVATLEAVDVCCVLAAGDPKLAAPNVKGTAAAAVFPASSLSAAGFAPKLKTAGAAVVEDVVAATELTGTLDVTESASVVSGELNLGTGNPETGATVGLEVAAAVWSPVRLNVTVAGLAGVLDSRSGAFVVEDRLPVIVVEEEMLPSEKGVEVVTVVSGADVTIDEADADTATSSVDFSTVDCPPKANGKPPLLESYAGGGAESNFSPSWKANPSDLDPVVLSSETFSLGTSVPFSLGVRAFWSGKISNILPNRFL